jgi:hypothetical protein
VIFHEPRQGFSDLGPRHLIRRKTFLTRNVRPLRTLHMSQLAKPRCLLRWTGVLLVATPILLFIASDLGFFPWSGINCTTHEVDIHSGRIRHARYIFFVPLERRIEDSALTKALSSEDIAGATPEWHPVITLSPGLRHSPHYVFHSAISQIRELEGAWELTKFTPTARRASAKEVLHLWQQAGGDDGAKDYLRAVTKLSLADDSEGRTIDARDLPK